MREIKTREEKERSKRINQILIGITLSLVLVTSVVGYSFFSSRGGNSGEKRAEEYRGLKFVQEGEWWRTEISGYTFTFKNLPQDTLNYVPINLSISSYANKPLYFVAEERRGVNEINMNLKQFVMRSQFACLENEKCEEDLPIKNCSDNVVVIKIGEKDSIRQEGNCVYLDYINDSVRVADSFLYKILGVKGSLF